MTVEGFEYKGGGLCVTGVVEYKRGVYTFDVFTCKCGKRISICRDGSSFFFLKS